ncbi:hypothetical protein MPSEU_001102900 [Mayamaea pseudoterrestris]|nr:hypothetical protein MPSEU_001102900 [Mayamaea pseudoterrestris]
MSSSDELNLRRTTRQIKQTDFLAKNEDVAASEDDDDDKNDDTSGVGDEDAVDDDNQSSNTSEDEEEESSEEPVARRKSSRTAQTSSRSAKPAATKNGYRRISSRTTKCTKTMTEPSDADFRMKRSMRETLEDTDESESESPPPPAKKRTGGLQRSNKPDSGLRDSLASLGSPPKSSARRHAKPRLSLDHSTTAMDADADGSFSDDGSAESESDDDDDDEMEEDGEPLRVHRILAVRTETLATWRAICAKIQTSEIDTGSRWHQEVDPSVDMENVFEERFLVKWSDLSYLHCSWETQVDLDSYTLNKSKAQLTTFFRKMSNGVLLSADERCDGDYFDPAWTQIERILDVEPLDGCPALTIENEDKATLEDYGIILDRLHKDFDQGTGRQFLVKWGNTCYDDASYEFERDLILADVDYKDEVKGFIRRRTKPKKSVTRELLRVCEKERRRLYKIFGEKSPIDAQSKEEAVEEYKLALQNLEFKNGGQLRDYQAEGVAWMLSNYINNRSCILADEMGLGKTLQTAASMNIIIKQICVFGPILIIAPLSTLIHWKREFQAWTDLNTIVYYGSANDRKHLRYHEFAYHDDRPSQTVGINQLYLKKCGSPKRTKTDCPWMVDVVLTTPEMMIADDVSELTAVEWECLVVDEAHRLKNHTSKLAVKLRDPKFSFNFKLLLTGTPIQNSISEFWTLLNFIEPHQFADPDDFNDKYADMKSKETIDGLHEEIRPFILRRLKEDVEKSVPPKEETLIEIEMTMMQKQYYRALYEKNVGFLHKTKKKAMDGPSLSNLAMQLRKCCNHTFLLNGVEDVIRAQAENKSLSEADLLVKASGKLVLLDKLLPRLKEEGHRVLMFSQFKIMLDILEDYFKSRHMVFERIDGSVTGHRRQQAIDRFQAPPTEGRESPFIMMLSTRSGGVGITLTAADTVIIFDSDWNPQADLQAQARCHRIGQTKSVKVYRLLTRKTYEVQMFHMASLKMGLDQAVLNGFEVGASGEGALSKEEIERLLRNGAYEIFKEDKEGKAEDESNEFIQQDIDTIMQRHARTVVHEGTNGTNRSAAGSTFSKASFKVAKSPDASGNVNYEDVDVDDPEFWKKVVGETAVEAVLQEALTSRREKFKMKSYAETALAADVEDALLVSDSDASDANENDDDNNEQGDQERYRWGGVPEKGEWGRGDFEHIIKLMSTHGYNCRIIELFKAAGPRSSFPDQEVHRMMWSVIFMTFLESVAEVIAKRRKREMEPPKDAFKDDAGNGGMLARTALIKLTADQEIRIAKDAFEELWKENKNWINKALCDAVAFAQANQPRDSDSIEQTLRPETFKSKAETDSAIASSFAQTWQSLKNRGWKATLLTEGDKAGKTKYEFDDKQYWTQQSVMQAASKLHPDLEHVCSRVLDLHNLDRRRGQDHELKEREVELELNNENVTADKIQSFMERYGCLQLLYDRTRPRKVSLPRRNLKTCIYMESANTLYKEAIANPSMGSVTDKLEAALMTVERKSKVPHPQWVVAHDATLICAIAKHGWIEQDASCRAIAQDSSMKWGPPFDGTRNSSVDPSAQNLRESFTDVLAVARRTASFLNANVDLLNEMKGIRVDELKKAYGLKQSHESEAGEDGDGNFYLPWIVDEMALKSASAAHEPDSNVAQDLPSQKDLLARAKLLLARQSIHHPVGEATTTLTKQVIQQPSYPFAVLDQSQRINALLAELLRGIMKAPPQKYLYRKKSLCALARNEALTLAESAKQQKERFSDMKRIVDHLDLVKRELTSTKSRLYKNVLRVILGDDPIPSKTEEAMFPTERAVLDANVLQTFAGSDNKSPSDSKTSGDRAFDAAARKLYVVTRGQENSDDLLDLTEIETLILKVACAVGLPVWQHDWKSLLLKNVACNDYALTWYRFSQILIQSAKDGLKQEEAKLASVQQAKGRIQGNSEAVLYNAKRRYNMREAACSQASEYADDPEKLAKKSVMMFPRLQRFLSKKPGLPVWKGDIGLDPKVLHWMETEVHRWSTSLELVDSAGAPLGFTAKDFMEDLPEEDRHCIVIAACVDKRGCYNILQQVAVISRLRNIFVTRDALITELVSEASESVASEKWELGIGWRGVGVGHEKDAAHDMLLLQRLIRKGFNSVHLDTQDYGITEVSAAKLTLQNIGVSKRAVQSRASLLAKALHDVDARYVVDVAMSDDSSVEIVAHSAKAGLKRPSLDDSSVEVVVVDKKPRAL